ncbi:mannose-6-phosphate isomerase [Candidatus Uhrbacteria bacterium RIFOXYB12_FULL_58_10]|uniref:Mannose-6-phosphate isomerase n=1 Tax=Candidatus Uhrbacteria bacterium RIFOXYB2_FULL_57_15 TaxID=1802422 RepID=A0A1F7W9B1_9BACT|nr:MAG: mannose-6-phosphate isomerase [Candidatus Uhrbacteria bacterium RIFOXYB12_FULL_58_10]OGL99359.1 MAG: mannose-6-phosphate isomerase [Candidatus Uhrbacteria bacterium RIFOXYB2_FULL_57_15]OGM00491.1 MAG: mannose-6-phosphate isomerase [Candidatus Uhrbacteria bacterium RIFOXYC12_FULL_57_11]
MNDIPENIRPWGRYDILDEGPTFKAKRISVNPGGRLSYQRHQRRNEVWVVVAGRATVTLNDEVVVFGPGETALVPIGTKHRVQNAGSEQLVFIEVQTGDYFGEDDIERFSDDYGRT